MPDFKKRLVVVDKEQPSVLAPKPTAEQRNQETEKLLTDLQKKVQTGTASKEEIGLYNQNAEMAKNFIKEVDNIRANADNYGPKLTKLFNEDLNRIGFDLDLYKKNTYSPIGIPGQQEYYINQNKDKIANQFSVAKNNFRTEGVKKLSQAETFIKNNDAAGLRSIAEYFVGPRAGTTTPSPLGGDKTDRLFYNKENFDKTNRKTANYLLNLARAIDVSNMISNPNDNRVPEVKNAINQNKKVVDILNNPGYLKSIGRELLSQEVGSKLYGQYQLDIHKKESAFTPDNLIDFEATKVAADAVKNLAAFDYRKKLAEYTRLKQFAEKTGNKVDVQKAENALKQSEDILRNTESFDVDKVLKTNYRQTYLEKKEEEAEAVLRRQGLGPIASGIPVDPVKLYYSIKAGLKSIANSYLDLAASWRNIGASDYEKAQNIYSANKLSYDKTGYTIGVDELGKPVESSQFRWKGADGKTHYNGYAIIESGLPVAEQMLETIALAEVGGGLIGGLRGAVTGAGRVLLGAERMALLGEKALATPVLGQITKAVSNPEVYNRMLTFGSVYTTTYPRIYAEEYNNFKNPEDAIKVAKMRSVVESLTESIIPNTPDLFKKGAVGLFDLGKKQYARDLSAGIDGVVLGLFPGASNKFIRNLGESATLKRAIGIGKDVFQEGVIEEEASLIGNYFVDKYAKSKNKDYVEENELTLKNIVNTAVESAAAMLLTAPFMGGGTKRNDNQSIIAARWNIANNPDLYKSVTASQLQAGEITQEQAAQKIAKIDQYVKALETLPIKNLSSIRDMKTLLENKDAQYEFFSKHLEKEALLDYVPTDEELPEYTKQLEKLDAELYKTQQLADKYDALSIEDKKKIIYDNFKSKLNDLTQSDDVSPAAIAASMSQAAADYKKNKNRLFSTELEGHINDLDAAMEGVKDKFKSFITNNNEGLTSEQRDYKTRLLAINRNFFEAEEVDKMLDVLTKAEVSAYAPLFEIQDENDFIEALARNYVTAKTNERPLTADGKLLYNLIQDQYVNDGLFERFVSKLPEDEALAKKEELKNRFWSRVVELKQKQEPGQVFPEVGTTPVTESEKFEAAATETDSKYKNLIANYRAAVERDITEDQQLIREETVDALVAEESLEDLVKALANVQSIFIGDNLKKIAEELQEGKTDKLVEFLEDHGATKKQIEKLLTRLGKPAQEAKAEVTPKTEAKEAVKVEEVLAGKTKPQIEAELKAKKEEIEKKRKEQLDKINQKIEKLKQREDRRVKIETYRTLDINDNPIEVEITTNADGTRVLKGRQINEDGSIEGMAYVTQRIDNKAQATLTNEQLIEGYIGNEGGTLQRTNIDENPDQSYIDKVNAEYDKQLAEVLQQEIEQLGKMMFDFTPEEQRVLKEFGSKTIPVVGTSKVSDIFQPVPEPLKETAADEANESQEKLNQEAKELQPIEDIRENYVYLGITDTSYDNKTRLTDENVALVFSVIDRIEESVNSKDIRSLGYSLLMHSAREVFNRAGLNIQPKPTLEEFTEQFRVNGILVLPKNQVEFLFKFPNAIDTIKLGIITNEKGEPLFFDKLGQKVTTGTPIITSIGQTFEKEEGKGGKTLDDQFRASIPEDGQIAPLSMFVNGRKIVNKPISVRETNNLILHATEKQAVPVGGKTFFLYKGVVYLKTDNPDFPYRSTYSRYNTKETAEEIVTLIEAYNDSKLNPESSTLPDYFKSMTPDELIDYIHNFAFIPKNSSKHDWGITPVTRTGETEARFLNIYKKTGATPEERKNSRKNPIPREEAVNLVATTAGAVSKKYFDGDIEFRPFKIENGKVKAEKAINFKAWFGDFRKSGARIDGVANRNLAFAKQDVKDLAQPVKKEKVETAVPVESLLPEEAPIAPVSDIEAKKADIERRRQESINSIVETYDKGADLDIGKTTITKADGSIESISDLKDLVTTGDPFQRLKDTINARYDAELAALEAKPEVTILEDPNKLPNDIKEEFKGRFIYATPGAGKTTLAQGMQGVVDTDILIVEEMKKRHPDFFAESGESIQSFIYRYVNTHDHKGEIDKIVLSQARKLADQGYTVLTGTAAFIKDADIIITAPVTLERIAQRFKNAQAAETFANKEAEEIKQSGKTAQPINNFLEYYLTNKGFVDPVDPSDTPSPVPTRRGRRGSEDQYTLLRSKIYANQITEAQNKAAKRWLETVGKKAFGEDRFIIEQFLTNPEAWATWSEAGVRLFADANFAELYHESWHEFTQMFFKPNQRESLYKEAAKIYGKLDKETLEEKLAEDFRQFMLTGIMPESIQKYKQSRTLFQKLADFLRNFFTNKKTVDRYFENLSVGKVGKRVGKPEFKTLKSAKTLSLYDNNDNLINLSFEESKRYLDMIDEVFVMLGNRNATRGKEEGQGLSYLNVMYSPENVKRMYDDIFDYFVYLEDQAASVKDLAAQNEIARIFGLGNKNIDRILDYHLVNSPLFTKEMVSEVEELEEEELSDTNILKDELGKKSQLELADTLVVNIIRTIPMVDSKGFMIINPLTDAPVFGDFTENWNILKNTLSGSTSYPEMLTRIEKLSDEYPQFGYLLAQLPKKITLDSAQQLRNLFFNTMSQEKVEGVQGNFNAEGKYNVSNTGTLDTKRVRDLWSLKFNTEKEGKYKVPSAVTSNFVLDPRIFEVYPEEPKSPEDVLDFLNGIGFNYSQKAQQAFIKDFNQLRTRFHYVYDKLKDVVLNSGTEVSDPFLSIREGHVNQKTGTLIKGKSYDLDRLVELESKHNLSFANDMIQTADGSSQFITNPPTYQTKVVAALNDPKYKYFEDLFVDFPELDPNLNWGLVNSAYLDYLFDFSVDTLVDGKVKHKRRTKDGEPVSLEIVTLNGVTSEEDYGFNEKTINLEDPEKHLGDVRTLLSPYGRVEENNRIGDKSTTRGLVLSNENYFLYNKDSYFREGKFNPKPQIWNIIYKYLEAEARITDKQSIQKEYGPDYDTFNKNKFFKGVPQLAYFSEILSPELRTQVYEFFQNNTIEDFEGSPLEGLVKSALITWINTSANESQDLLSKFDSYKIKGKKNDFQVTLDELKRYHTLSMIHRIEQYKLFNYHPYYYKNAKEVEKRIGAFNAYGTFSVTDRENLEYTQTSLTMQKAFNDFADKTGIETLPRKGGLEDVTYLVAEDERLDSQTARENKEDYGIHYNNYAETKKKVDVQDAASLFTLDFFRKFHATSKGLSSNMKKEMDRQASIWANLLEIKSNPSNTEARDNMNKLLNEGPYFIFSVEKLQYAGPGKTPAELVPLFHKYSNKILLPSEMVDNEELFNIAVKLHASNADYLVFNTGTKIAETVKPVKLFSNGKVDSSAQDTGVLSLAYLKEQQEIKHKDDQLIIFATQFRKLLFKDVTTPEEKNLLKVYKAYIKELTGYDVENYLSKITDKKDAVEFLVKELDKKNVSAITKDLIRVKETNGELEYAVDSIIERTLAESAIASSIRKSIIRQKFNGTQFVQFPVSLVRPDRKLKFYRIKNGKIASAEAIISFSKKYHSLLDLPFDDKSTIGKFDKDGNIINRYEALKRLNQKLKDDAFREKYKDSLTLAGVRIPVQGYNSMEKMEIVEFLPEESGQMILVPDELVVKSGGDFDIDKLFMYEPILKNGLMLTEENSTDPEKQKRSIIQNKLLNVIKERLSQKEIFLDLIEPNNVKDLDEFAKKAPEYLSGDTNKIIKDASGRDMWTNLINPHYQLYVYQLAQAMGMVGVAAKANTFQAAAQDAKLEIVDESQIDLIYLDTHKNSEGHIQLWKIYDVDNNNKISQVISQIISGAVDIVKNDNILKNNINPNTVSVALYLNMMGVRYEDINALLRDELVYRLSKGESFQDILRKDFREQYDYYGTFNMNGGFSNYGTAKAILSEFNKEDLLTDKSPAGSLARLAQFVILQSQQNNYVTPLLLNSDFDTQSFQNFEAVLRKEKAIQKVYADKFFNTDGITGVIYNSIVSPFKIDSSFIKNFEDIFPISANKGLTNYIVDFYGELENPWIDYENFSRRFKNGLLTSILETNMSEFEEYAQYLKVDPTIKNLQDMASEIKKEAAENGAYIPLLDSINFSGDINSDYIAPGIFRNDNNLDVDIKKEQFKNNLNWDPFREQEVSQEFRKKVREFFRIFAYAGIISTQLNKTHSSFLEIIPEEIYTPVVDRFVRATAADISKGSKSEYLNTFRTRFVYNNPDIFNFRSFDRIPNPSLRFFRNYNLNIPQEQLQKDYPNLVPRLKENVPSTPVFPNNINPDVKLPETQIVEDIKQVEKEEAEQLAEESSEYASLEQELQVLQRQLKELRDQEKYARESSPALIVSENLPKINIKSAERETGGKVGVGTQDINYNLVSEKGVSVERAAEEISENILNGIDNVKVEFSDVFNMIVDILFIGKAKFEAKFLPSAAEKKELMKRIAEVKEKIKQQPKQKVRKKFKPVEKIPGQLDLFANKDEIDKLTTENTALINDFFSDDKPVDWNIIDIINNQDDSECPF